MADGDIVYRIDDQDLIVYVNAQWDAFALSNGGGAVASPFVLQRSIWEFIADEVTTNVYREAFRVVREGHHLHFSFRCDSPDCRRLLRMGMSCRSDGLIEMRSQTLRREQRLSQKLLDIRMPRSSESLRLCSWCKKAFVGDVWIEVDDAFDGLRLHERETLPEVKQGTCDECFEKVSAELDRNGSPSGRLRNGSWPCDSGRS